MMRYNVHPYNLFWLSNAYPIAFLHNVFIISVIHGALDNLGVIIRDNTWICIF